MAKINFQTVRLGIEFGVSGSPSGYTGNGTEMPGEVLPATARAISLLLTSNPAIQDVHPGVLHQLLEFSHRYTYQVLSDALVYAEHAGRAGKIELEDVMLAIQARVGWELGGRVPKEVRKGIHS
jgi:hypothetical protein